MSLRAAAIAAVLGAAAAAPVTGADAVRLVAAAMTAAGLPPPDMPVPARALPPCAHSPAVAPRHGDWSTVELRCDAPQAWTRALRTGAAGAMAQPGPPGAADSTAEPAVTRPVLTLARPLARGARLSDADLAVAEVAGLVAPQTLQDPALAVGRRLRVALAPGQPLLDRHLDPRLDVEPGMRVTLLLQAGVVEIATQAEALQGGVTGDWLRLRNLSGGREVEAQVIGPGILRARANMP